MSNLDPVANVEAREHMRRCPDHELTIDSDDRWRCLTCEAEEGEQS